MVLDGNYLVFSSTGRRAYAYSGIIGLSVEFPFCIYYGYDGYVGEDLWSTVDHDHGLNLAERHELAKYMITMWERVRDEETVGGL